MIKVLINSLELENFKGFVELKIDLTEKENQLYGRSGCGKSTIKDAWLWVCGIDIESPNPYINNKVVPDIETCVRCRISVGKNEYKLSRTSKQKWKTLEDGSQVFNGFTSNGFEFDGVPMIATTYRDKICEIFGIPKYEYLKFLCDTNYFNEELDYKKRREILFKIGDVANKTAELNNQEEFALIRDDLAKGLTTNDITKAINSTAKSITTAKKDNSTRIAERSADLTIDYDFDELKSRISELEQQYRVKTLELEELNKGNLLEGLKKRIAEKENLLSKLELADLQENTRINNEKAKREAEVQEICSRYEQAVKSLEELKKQKDSVENSEYTTKICPVCKQEINVGKSKEDAIKEFEAHKKATITDLNSKIQKQTFDIQDLQEVYQNKVLKNADKLEFAPNPQIEIVEKEKAELEKELLEKKNSINDNKELKFELQCLESEIREISGKLAFEKIKESADARIRQLEKNNLELAKLERENNLKRICNEKYLMTIVKLVNESINSKFDVISWNLFDTFNADAEQSFKEECEVIFEDRIYRQCSTGQKLIANFYTTLGLQKAFGVSLPIFFDEAQSSTFDRECEQQLIELITNKETSNINGIRLQTKEIINAKSGDI